jgi:hypothetical protein
MGNGYDFGGGQSSAIDPKLMEAIALAMGGGSSTGGLGQSSFLQAGVSALNGPPGLNLAAGAIGSVLSYFGGAGKRKEYKKRKGEMEGMIGKDIFSPEELFSKTAGTVMRKGRGMAKQLTPRYGAGAKAALYESQLGELGDIYSSGWLANAQSKAQRDLNIKGMLFQDAASRV